MESLRGLKSKVFIPAFKTLERNVIEGVFHFLENCRLDLSSHLVRHNGTVGIEVEPSV
jgi:hypothetical protein